MLAMTAVIVDYTFKMCFYLFIFNRRGPSNVAGPGVTYPLLSFSTGLDTLITR